MLKRLSARNQKEIALSFMAVFFISGLNTLKAELNSYTSFVYTGKFNNSVPHKNKTNDLYANGKSILAGDVSSLSGGDKGKRKKDAALRVKKLQNFSETDGKAKFSKPFIGGPSQPEMNAFKSVGSDNMVSPFTGDFSYNIPLLDVGGYPVNMFYSSGITMDQESSWLGLGWNINPGTITRNMRGLPDDFDGSDMVTKKQSFRPDETWGVTTGADVKFSGIPSMGLGLGVSGGASYNNKLGIATEAGVHTSISLGAKAGNTKTANLSFSVGLNASSRGGASVTPSVGLSLQNQEGQSGGLTGSIGVGYTYSSRMGLSSMHLDVNASGGVNKGATYTDGNGDKKDASSSMGGSFNSTLSFAYPSIMPSISKRFTKASFSLNTSVGLEYWWVNPTFKLGGYYTKTYIADDDKITTHPAYGMLYYQKSDGNDDAMLDFNRANDGIYTPASPAIAMPVYTYDVFSISGEGTGGSFRAYRGDIGHMRDARVETKEQQGSVGLDLGFGNLVHGGASMSYVYTPTIVGDWTADNATGKTFSFDDNLGRYQAVYFKNPSEKTVPDAGFQDQIANEDLVRLKLGNAGSPKPIVLPRLIRYDAGKNRIGDTSLSETTRKIPRDKRTQVISFLTAEEADRIGSNTKIYSYRTYNGYEDKVVLYNNCYKDGIDSLYRYHDTEHEPHFLGNENIGFRKKNHISQIDVLGSDGRKYVYGLPVYNKKQVEVTFSINSNQKASESKALYNQLWVDSDNTIDNGGGRDWIFDRQEMPPYTHSYLLTALLSPNYVDLTGNGITEDDMGDGIKFNYSKFDDYKWRTPVGEKTASYSSGLKTDNMDDKAHYIYGERESWYLYSVESKNMVARFYVKDRTDGRAVLDEDGKLDGTNGMKKLVKISLFSKADLTKNPVTAKPIKTIHFFQSYKLCLNKPGSNELGSNMGTNSGKLTLDSIWITYNGNQRKPKSRYVFYYPDNTNNPDYGFDQTDRWGNYKPVSDNPSLGIGTNISNEDYPYSVQDKTKADKNAAAWTMNKILLPSGAVIKIDYESDSYAYVQDKKAANMFQVLGFGTSETALPNSADLNKLYTDDAENDHVYIQLPYPINITGSDADKKREFVARYLEDVQQFYLKIAVIMPTGEGLSGIPGTENIGVYADAADYGLISPTVAWIKVGGIGVSHTPMVQAALQFLTQQLPGKAYKGYDGSAGGNATISALAGMIDAVKGLFNGEFDVLMGDKKCQQVELNKTFARLTNPTRNKFGGGLRVKRVVINDNWAKMTNQLKATYGQEYKYTTTELINNKLETISSGVAAWEPSIGGDENPHRKIQRYVDHNKAGPYDFGAIEMPLGEMFYPGAMVGYSRVEVLSIHRDTVKNLPTRQVTEFYTNKDFPYKSSATDLTGDAHAKYDPPKIMQLLKIDLRKNVTLSQGFLIETNDMNGKEKGHATYTASDSITPVSYTRNYYNTKEATDKTLTFNHTFPVIAKADGLITNALIGRDIELMTDFREHTTQTISRNIDFNFDMAMWGPYPIPICMVLTPVTKESTMYRSAAVLKIVTHFGMLDSVVVIDKGSMVSTKNLVYDAETGNPLLTRTQNEHNKPVYNFSYPAHWAYSGMGPAYRNIDAIYTKVKFTHGILTEGASNIFDILESGDEIYTVSTKDGLSGQTYTPPCDDQANITPENAAWTSLEKNPAHRIWAVGMAKVGGSANSWVFMDEYGNPYNAKDANIRIVRSGKRNMLDQSVGAVTSLVDPRVSTVINNTVNVKLAFNEATKIIQTSAATFKDNWRVDNSFYKAIESVINNEYARVHRADLYPDGSDGFLTVYSHKTGSSYDDAIIEQNTSMHLYKYSKGWSDALFNEYHSQIARKIGFLRYSYNTIPTGAKLYKAMLSLYSHTNNLFTTGGTSSSYPPADHPGVHTANGSQNNIWMLGEVYGLNKDWYPTNHTTTNAWTWINNYFNSDPANVTTGKGIIPYCTSGGWDSYFFNGNNDNRINITLPLKTITGSTLASLKKIGLKVRLENDEYQDVSKKAPEVINYRCFWSPNASTCQTPTSPNNPTGTSNKSCESAKPMLSYYYYKWGITTPQNEYLSDPTVNTMLTRHVSTTTGIFCRSKFTERKSINPYTEGVLGNWRVDSTYAYYGERKETVPDNPVDTRTGGTIKDYTNFWNFAPNNTDLPITRNQQAGNVWVWNSAITQYNRKGYEIENTDPLGRFNSGLYGYNQQLPVAVANNARVREIMFDSFEDYSYQTTPNCTTCKPHRNFNYSTDGTIQIDPGQKHSGANSLRVNAGKTVLLQAPVSNTTEPNKPYGLKIKPSTISYTNPQLGTGGISGTGLTASYYNHAVTGSPMIALEPAVSNTSTLIIEINPVSIIKIPPNGNGLSPATGVSPTYFSVKWHGRIQAPATAMYYFSSIADNGYRLTIGSTQVSNPSAWGSLTNGNEPITTGIPLIAGNDYPIEICYYNNWGPYQFDLRWKYGTMSSFAQIPTSVLYPPGTIHFQNLETVNVTCNRLDSIQVTGNALTDTFSLLQGKKMLLSAWVKVGTANCCFPPTYADNNTNSITINYNEGSIIIEPSMKPSGRVIEGWQRYESDFIVPLNATDITVSLNNTTINNTGNPNNDIPVFFDDIRIQPFNANMKSFVYHPSNLRLMAELDENNYASYYEYDDDGTLTRVKKETVKGIKTITETRSATQKKIIKED